MSAQSIKSAGTAGDDRVTADAARRAPAAGTGRARAMKWPGWVVAVIGVGWSPLGAIADPVEVLPPVALSAPTAELARPDAPKANSPHPPDTATDTPKSDGKPTFEIRGRFEADALGPWQSLANRLTVGDLQAATGFRRARLGAQGHLGESLRWVSEFDFADGNIAFKDVFAGLGGLPVPGELRVGHFREPFGLEGQISSNYFPLMERSPSNAFDPARNWGIGLFTHTADETATLAFGVFRAGSNSIGESVTEDPLLAYTARTTWLPFHDGADDPESLVHVGGAASYRSIPGDAIAFQPSPQSSLLEDGDSPLPPLIRGMTIPANHAQLYNLEAAATSGPAWAMAEWRAAVIDQISGPRVVFSGWYVSAGYFLTGEHRRYDRAIGTFDGVKVLSPVYRADDKDGQTACGFGAWELVARIAYLDLTSPNVPQTTSGFPPGGYEIELTIGVNWYLTDFARLMVNYVHFRTRPPVGRWSDGDVLGARFAVYW
jgi:phosphate-selective porin OprO and OprP